MDKETNLIFEKYKQVNENLGLGPNTPSIIHIKVGETKALRPKTQAPTEDEMVYIQAGETDEAEDCGCGGECGDDCGCNDKEGKTIYDGELDMARLELLKANEYAAKLFHHIGNHPESDYLEGWVASKITKAADYLSSVYHYLDYEDNFPTKEPCYSDEEEGNEDEDLEVDDDEMTKTARETGFGA